MCAVATGCPPPAVWTVGSEKLCPRGAWRLCPGAVSAEPRTRGGPGTPAALNLLLLFMIRAASWCPNSRLCPPSPGLSMGLETPPGLLFWEVPPAACSLGRLRALGLPAALRPATWARGGA